MPKQTDSSLTTPHMHLHFYPRRAGDTPKPGPVWQLGEELYEDRFRPDEAELEDLKRRLNAALDQIKG